jgi:hypothetical protein
MRLIRQKAGKKLLVRMLARPLGLRRLVFKELVKQQEKYKEKL